MTSKVYVPTKWKKFKDGIPKAIPLIVIVILLLLIIRLGMECECLGG